MLLYFYLCNSIRSSWTSTSSRSCWKKTWSSWTTTSWIPCYSAGDTASFSYFPASHFPLGSKVCVMIRRIWAQEKLLACAHTSFSCHCRLLLFFCCCCCCCSRNDIHAPRLNQCLRNKVISVGSAVNAGTQNFVNSSVWPLWIPEQLGSKLIQTSAHVVQLEYHNLLIGHTPVFRRRLMHLSPPTTTEEAGKSFCSQNTVCSCCRVTIELHVQFLTI